MLKHAPLTDLLRMPFLVVSHVLLRGRAAEEAGEVTDAVGTIGLGRSLKERGARASCACSPVGPVERALLPPPVARSSVTPTSSCPLQ